MKRYHVTHNEKEHRFEIAENRQLAMVEYQLLDKDIMNIYHTEVPEVVRGKGIGTAMMKEALEFARLNHYKVLPTCPFAQDYLKKHADELELLS